MVVAVHEYPGLREVVLENRRKRLFEVLGLRGGELPPQLAGDVPLGEQAQFSLQQFAVVVGQRAGAARQLYSDERVERVSIERPGAALVERVQVGRVAEIREQQKALDEILRMYRGNVHAGFGEKPGDANEGLAAFLLGRSVHRNERWLGAAPPDPEVAPEARIVGRRSDAHLAAERCVQPSPQLLSAVQNSSGNKELPSPLICAILALAPLDESYSPRDMSFFPARSSALAIALLCSASVWAQGQGLQLPRQTRTKPDPSAPITLDADRLEGVSGRSTSAQGNAVLRQGDLSIRAESLKYSEESEEVEATGNVRLERGGDALSGPSMRYSLKGATGQIDKPEFTLAPRVRANQAPVSARGKAEAIEFLGEDQYRIKNGFLTTCKPGDDGWYIRADALDLDLTREVGTAHGARMYFEGVPILAAPTMDFSLNNQRKSGFLPPSTGITGKSGLEIGIPYYLNLAPNYDLTLTPRYLQKRGTQIAEQARYLGKNYTAELDAEQLPNDRTLNEGRSATSFVANYNREGTLLGGLNLNKVSDDNYFRDLSTRISITSQATLPREGFVTYNGKWWGSGTYSTTARIQTFQVLQDPENPIVAPYGRTPQLTLTTLRQDIAGFDFKSAEEFVDFSHPTLVTGKRATVYPSLSLPLISPQYFLTPKVGYSATYYSLDQITMR